jgi:hypothetical protein
MYCLVCAILSEYRLVSVLADVDDRLLLLLDMFEIR